MHVLVTNDDGPPSSQSSPYILSFVHTLQSRGHTVSVVLPHIQRSWIGKAHMVGKSIRPSYYRPPPPPPHDPSSSISNFLPRGHCDKGTISHRPLPKHSTDEEWILVDSTPASCIQIGLYHYFRERGPVELVISGPNYGRNTTAVFSLSSGTIGGALEAAMCGVRAVALSYAFYDRSNEPEAVAETSRVSVRIVEALMDRWASREDVHLYSLNVPLLKGVEDAKVLWTRMLQNEWRSGSCFTEVEVSEDGKDWGPEEGEIRIRSSESLSLTQDEVAQETRDGLRLDLEPNGHLQADVGAEANQDGEAKGNGHLRYSHKHFRWSPRFRDVHDSVERAPPGNDGWAVKEGFVSITPLKANFMHVDGFEGEVKL